MSEHESETLKREGEVEANFEESLRQSRPRAISDGSLEKELSIALILAESSGDRKSDVEIRNLGRLLVRSRIGGGGMGIVYGAYDPNLRRNVAIKLLRGDIERSKRELVAAEARALAQMSHPNVVTIYEIVDDGDELYFVMELIQGVTLREWLDAHLDAGWREVVSHFVQAGRGLCAAHEKGIVHGDFKPRNVLVGDDRRLRVVDFGLAQRSEVEQPHLVGGTLAYMAPEVLTGAAPTDKSDQYNFCASLRAALKTEAIPERLQRLLRTGLREVPEQRHEHFDNLLNALERETQVRRNRSDAMLLERVERLWLSGVLYRSLAGFEAEPMRLRARTDLIDSPWASWAEQPRISREHKRDTHYSSNEIERVLEESYNALLIVGEPGSGKTTLLLQLCQQLWRRASDSDDAPRPVVLNISSFDEEPQGAMAENFATWVVDEVVAKYGLPRSTIRSGLQDASVALLLDGLDEAHPSKREALVEAVNAFREVYPVPVVVSCRDSEYASIKKKLRFGGAVEIEPLEDEAVLELMQKRGASNCVSGAGPIQEMFRNPLLLTLCARGASAAALEGELDWKGIYEHVVARSLRRAGEQEDVERMEAQLSFLAKSLQDRGTTDLWIEGINFSWIPSPVERMFVYLVGILCVLIFGVGLNVAQVPLTNGPFTMALTFGLGVSIGSFAYTRGQIRPVERLRWSWRRALRLLPITTACASLVGLAQALQVNFVANMTGAAITGVILAFSFALEPGEQASKVRPNIGIRRSLAYASSLALAFGIPVALLFGLVINPFITRPLTEMLVYEGHHGLIVGASVGLFVFTAMFLIYGGFTVIMHAVLRLWLAVRTPLPLNLTKTLDRFVELDLMRRVGGGYVFLHRTLLDYLAEKAEE